MALIGFSGAHRTGKTTLAKKFAEVNGFVYVDAGVSELLKEAGYDSSRIQTLGFVDFIKAQRIVLNHIIAVAQRFAPDPNETYVMDRTPLDAVAYYRAYFSGAFFYQLCDTNEKASRLDALLNEYTQEARAACKQYFAMIVGVQPGIEIREEEGKALAKDAFVEQLHVILTGEMYGFSEGTRSVNPYCAMLSRDMIDLDERVETANYLWKDALALSFYESKKSARSYS